VDQNVAEETMTECRCLTHNGFLTARGYRAVAQQDSLEGLSPRGVDEKDYQLYLDKVGSVSALTGPSLHWDDALLEEQHQRFLNGS